MRAPDEPCGRLLGAARGQPLSALAGGHHRPLGRRGGPRVWSLGALGSVLCQPLGAVGGARGWSLGALGSVHRRPRGAVGGARGWLLGALGGVLRQPLGAVGGARGWSLGALGGARRRPLGAVGGARCRSLGAMVVELRLAASVVRAVSLLLPLVMGGDLAHLFTLGGASGGGVASLGVSPALCMGTLEWTSVSVLRTMGRSTFGVLASVDGTLCHSVGSLGGQTGGCRLGARGGEAFLGPIAGVRWKLLCTPRFRVHACFGTLRQWMVLSRGKSCLQ